MRVLAQGIDAESVRGLNAGWPLMRHVFGSLGNTRFVVGMEERFGITAFDRYSLRLRSLNDFAGLVAKESGKRATA